MVPVEANGRGNVEVGDSVPVSHTEGIFMLNIVGDPFEPSSRARVVPRIDQGYAPWFGNTLMHLHSVLLHVEGDIRHVEKIIREVFLDQITLVATTDDKVVDSVLRIDLEDVPQDGSPADFYHRFG